MTRLFIYEAISAGSFGNNPPPSLQREGLEMLNAVAEDFARVPGVRVSTQARVTLGPVAPVECRRCSAEEEADVFRRMVHESDAVLVIAPELGGLLTERCALVAQAGRRSLGCTPEAARLASDKLVLCRHWREHGVPTPDTRIADRDDWNAARAPLVLKPRHGAGSQAMRQVTASNEGPGALAELREEAPGEEFIVQPWHAGLAASVHFLCGPAGDHALRAGEQRLSDDGRCQYLGSRIPLPEPWHARAVALGTRALAPLEGRHGYVGVDLVLGEAEDGSQDVAIEINPRLTTSYLELRRCARESLAEAWWRCAAGESVELHWRG